MGSVDFWDLCSDAQKKRIVAAQKGRETRRKRKQVCVLCGENFGEYGNNPDPCAFDGECCDHCNLTKVIPARLAQVMT